MKTKKWYNPTKHSGWSKDLPVGERRKLALKAHKNDLSAARSLQALANVTTDKKTQVEAQKDADYFYRQNKIKKGK